MVLCVNKLCRHRVLDLAGAGKTGANMKNKNYVKKRGFLPFETNLFDRLFIGAVVYFAVHLFWYRFLEEWITIRVANVLMLVVAFIIAKWGGQRKCRYQKQ